MYKFFFRLIFMALILGVNCGFVTVAPVGDPDAISTAANDDRCIAIKHASPPTAVKVTEIGWYTPSATEEADYEVGIYNSVGTEPGLIVAGKSAPTAKGTGTGWKVVTGLNITISPSTDYWLAVQLDDTLTFTAIDYNGSGGSGRARLDPPQTELPADWGASDSRDTNAKMAIYAVWKAVEEPPAESLFMDLSTHLWTLKHSQGLFTKL